MIDDDPKTFEILLSYMYNRTYKALTKDFTPPLSDLRGLDQGAPDGSRSEELLAIPSRSRGHKLSSAQHIKYANDNRYHDPLPEQSAFHCVVLLQHAKTYTLADAYLVSKLAKEACQAFANLLCDCWNSSDILGVIEFVMSSVREGSDLRKVLEIGLLERADMLVREPKFAAVVRTSRDLAIFFALMDRDRCKCKYNSGFVYCSFYKCRRNVQHRLLNRLSDVKRCNNCRTAEFTSQERSRMWPHEGAEDDDEAAAEDKPSSSSHDYDVGVSDDDAPIPA